MSNYYDILEVTKSADAEAIKHAYRKLAKQYHPDQHGGDDRRFVQVNEAYGTLSDPVKRAEYDHTLTAAAHRAKSADATATDMGDFGYKRSKSAHSEWDPPRQTQHARPVWSGTAPSKPAKGSSHTSMFGQILRRKVVSILAVLLAIWAADVLVTHFTDVQLPSNSASGGVPFQIQGEGGSSGGNAGAVTVPQTGTGDNEVTVPSGSTPSPSPTPTCPSGAPSITIGRAAPSAAINEFGEGGYTYDISGEVSNPTTSVITINSVGFYDGAYNASEPPDWTADFSSMSSDGSSQIQPGQTVSWSVTQTLPEQASGLTAVLTYPQSAGATPTAQWSFVDSNCSSDSGSGSSSS